MWNKKRLFIGMVALLSASALHAQWSETGIAAHYADNLHGKPTASGELYDKNALTAAYYNLPLGSRIRVTRTDNGQSVEVRVNDCCRPHKGRIVDLSRAAAERIDLIRAGTAPVRIDLISLGDGKRCGGETTAPKSYEDGPTLTARGATPMPIAQAGPTAPGIYVAEAFRPIRVGFGVQVGAFSNKDNADAKVDELQKKGFNNVLVSYAGPIKVPYRVLIGPFDNRNAANSYNGNLASKYKIKGIVVDLSE